MRYIIDADVVYQVGSCLVFHSLEDAMSIHYMCNKRARFNHELVAQALCAMGIQNCLP